MTLNHPLLIQLLMWLPPEVLKYFNRHQRTLLMKVY